MELNSDPDTTLLVQINDVDTLKSLIILLNDISNGSDELFWTFNHKYIRFTYRYNDKTSNMYLDVVCKLKGYHLTKYIYDSKGDVYIIILGIKSLINTIKTYNSKKGDIINISRKKGDNFVKIFKNKNYYDKIKEKSFINEYKHFEPFKYKTSPHKPIAVVCSTYFAEICKEYLKYEYTTIPISVCEHGIALIYRTSTGKVPIRIFGVIDGDPIKNAKWKCVTSPLNLSKLSKIDRLCPNANIRIYMENNDGKKILPMKISCSIGDMGSIDFYLEVRLTEF